MAQKLDGLLHRLLLAPHAVFWWNDGFVPFVQTLFILQHFIVSLFRSCLVLQHKRFFYIPDSICLVQNLSRFLCYLGKGDCASALGGP